MLLGSLVFISTMLTYGMFKTRQSMMGFPCAMFWAVLSAYCYIESAIPWGDIYYYMFFAAAGMTIFTALAAFGLREKHDTLADESMEKGDSKFIDEKKVPVIEESDDPFSLESKGEKSRRSKDLEERAMERRSGGFSKRRARG